MKFSSFQILQLLRDNKFFSFLNNCNDYVMSLGTEQGFSLLLSTRAS